MLLFSFFRNALPAASRHAATTDSIASHHHHHHPAFFFFFFLFTHSVAFSCLASRPLFLVFFKFHFCCYCLAKRAPLPAPLIVTSWESGKIPLPNIPHRALRGCRARQILLDVYLRTKVVQISWKERGSSGGPVWDAGSIWQKSIWETRKRKLSRKLDRGRRKGYFQSKGSSTTKNNFTDFERINWFWRQIVWWRLLYKHISLVKWQTSFGHFPLTSPISHKYNASHTYLLGIFRSNHSRARAAILLPVMQTYLFCSSLLIKQKNPPVSQACSSWKIVGTKLSVLLDVQLF